MKKTVLTGASGAAACLMLAACSSTGHLALNNQLTQKTVNYECSAQDQRSVNLEVQYTFQGDSALTAQVIYDNQAISLARDNDNKANMAGNTFTGNGYVWSTGEFTLATADKVDGNMLTRSNADTGGPEAKANTILARNCKVRG
ncbi:hypothetical protein CDEF62S_00740 [Castellaniella defragrans]